MQNQNSSEYKHLRSIYDNLLSKSMFANKKERPALYNELRKISADLSKIESERMRENYYVKNYY